MTQIETLHVWFTIFLMLVIIIVILLLKLWSVNQAYYHILKWFIEQRAETESLKKQLEKLNQKDKPDEKHYGC